MNYPEFPYRIFPLGDASLTVDFGNVMDEAVNKTVLAIFHQFRNEPLPGMIEAVPAYSSVTVHYDLLAVSKSLTNGKSAYEYVSESLAERLKQAIGPDAEPSKLLEIPVCYEKEFAPDIERVANEKHLSVNEVIRIHSLRQYRVYMIGFLPGFPYLGEVSPEIAISRKPQPANVIAGSVGIAGKQTGIYPFNSPGGWQIIGRTPLKLFDAEKEEPSLLKAGDRVQFVSISKDEFKNY